MSELQSLHDFGKGPGYLQVTVIIRPCGKINHFMPLKLCIVAIHGYKWIETILASNYTSFKIRHANDFSRLFFFVRLSIYIQNITLKFHNWLVFFLIDNK